MSNQDYNANDMQHLSGLAGIQKRPGMYIGTTGSSGLTHLAFEMIDNSVDEAVAGYCDKIIITLYKDGSVGVEDNGRGIPTEIHSKTGLPAVLAVFTLLHFGGKFGGGNYKVGTSGLHGVGSSVVAALSTKTSVTVKRDGEIKRLELQRGKLGKFAGESPDTKFTPQKDNKLQDLGKMKKGERTGTTVRFWPDAMIFIKGSIINTEAIYARARQTAFLVPGLTISIVDETSPDGVVEETFCYTGGVVDMVDHLATDQPICDTIHIKGEGVFTETVPMLNEQGHMESTDVDRTVEVDIALRWGNGYDSKVASFVNVVSTPKEGTHVKGFERALVNTLRKSYDGTRLLKANEDLPNLEDMGEGLTAVVSIGVPEPQFVGQTKEELGTAGVTKVVQDIVNEGLKAWVSGKKKTQVRTVLEKIANASRVRVAHRTQKEAARRKTALEGASMPAKLVDCRAIGVEGSELLLVEGDSALGSARQGRNSEFQALLPLRGKILNVQKATLKQMLDNAECSSIIQVLGAGSGRTFDIEQMRYSKILLLSDADVDGLHISVLLTTFFYKMFKPLVVEGRLYKALPPLHKIEVLGRNKEILYTYSAAEMEETVARLRKAGKKIKEPIQRYKGLGEMDAEELWETTMNPVTRSLKKITMDDVEAAENMLELLMGSDVPSRRKYIVDNADQVEDIDT